MWHEDKVKSSLRWAFAKIHCINWRRLWRSIILQYKYLNMPVSLNDHRIFVDGSIILKIKSTTTRSFRTINRVTSTMFHLEQGEKACILAVTVREAFLKTHTRYPSYRHGYDLTPSGSSPESSPVRENRPVHKGKVTSQSISHHRDKHTNGHHGDTRRVKVYMGLEHPTRCDARGSSNADLKNQVDQLKARLKDITPGRGQVKHSALFPFLDRLRHVEMPCGFKMPKFKTFSGIGDPSNHLKSFDSQLSFWVSDDEVYVRAFQVACLAKC
ncbi:hypothetical protein LIER_36054 [Lithospermum erythrorhizon]|uniref:Uncharacterized protein n=1 Tax=Lithospermum erythrorhizon TaxID=34254 RepID=A0AAV3P0D9_LITER